MNRKIMFSFIATLVMLAPSAAFAQTDTLTALQQQIAALQQQLMSLQGKQSGGGSGSSLPTEKPKPIFEKPQQHIRPGDQPEDEGITTPITFDRDLYLGLRNDSDVSNLQEFLTDQGFYNQTISGNFFILTRNAVKKFQQAHGIKPSGYFGSLTRTVANKILVGGEVPPVTLPPFPVVPVPVSAGHLNIDPAYAVLKIGETQRIRAIFTPPRPACLDANPSCKVAERAPYEVQASFVSDNPKIAMADEAVSTCPVPVSGIQSSCPDPLHFVRGVAQGDTVIIASYAEGGRAYGAKMKVSVGTAPGTTPVGSMTLTAPNGGQQWQLNSLHTITWAPYDPNSGVNPAKEVTAYLERMVNGQYVTVGKIIESGKASIHWIGEIDTYGNYPPPGDYYIRIVNNRTGESDRSDYSFRLVPTGTLLADLKVNGSDGPIAVPAGGADYAVSWQSGASSCSIYNNAASNSGGAQLTNLRPTGSQVMHFIENSQAYTQYISLECLSKSPVEGSASDNVQLLPSAAPLTVLSPNGGENIDLSQLYDVTWKTTADVGKVSIALYKNDKWFAWIAPSISINYGSGGSYTWTPSQTISQSDTGGNVFKIYMIGYKTSGGTVEDKSDAPFGIIAGTVLQPAISVLSPNNGEVWQTGNTYSIRWSSNGASGTKTIHAVGSVNGVAVDKYLGSSNGDSFNYTVSSLITPPGNWTLWVCGRYCPGDGGFGDSRAISVGSGGSVSTDLRITSITRATFHPYGFNMTICTDGPQSINDLKKTIPNLTNFPADYVVYDLQGNRHRGDASSGGSTEDMKNGQCQTLGWTIQQSEQAYYDQTKKVELFLDPANLVAETNESNNSLVFAENQTTLPDLAPVSMTIDPSIPVAGKSAILTIVFTNKGGATASGINFSTDLGYQAVSSPVAGNNCVNGMTLAPGASCTIKLDVIYSSFSIANTIKTQIDIDNVVKESDENNNSMALSFPISSAQSSITVISPNGGETYTIGKENQMEIKWTADCGFQWFALSLVNGNGVSQSLFNGNTISAGLCSVGERAVPYYTTTILPVGIAPGAGYKILIYGNTQNGSSKSDNSDAPFSIVQP